MTGEKNAATAARAKAQATQKAWEGKEDAAEKAADLAEKARKDSQAKAAAEKIEHAKGMKAANAKARKSDLGMLEIKLESAKTRAKVDATQCLESKAHGKKLREANVRMGRI